MTEQNKKAKELIDKFKEEIEKEAIEYANYSWKELAREKQDANGSMEYFDGYDIEDCCKDGFISGVKSKISERIKVEFALKILEELKQESPFPNYVPHQYINNKITELKNSIK